MLLELLSPAVGIYKLWQDRETAERILGDPKTYVFVGAALGIGNLIFWATKKAGEVIGELESMEAYE